MASDSPRARAVAASLVERLGWRAADLGGLAAARAIEDQVLAMFPEWRRPLAISIALWLLLYLVQFGRYYLCQVCHTAHVEC